MAFDINNFVTQGLNFGGARPTLFKVRVQFPTGVVGIPSEALQKFEFTCRSSSIPASSIASVPVPYFGRTVKVAGDRSFADWSVTVMNDEDYIVRNSFEVWHNAINTIQSNLRISGTTEDRYKGTAEVIHYSKNGSTIKTYKITNIFPVNVDEMALDWEAQNQIQTFGVTFAYDWWEPIAEVNKVKINTPISIKAR